MPDDLTTHESMNIERTLHSTHMVTGPAGQLCLNLVPMNTAAADNNGLGVGYASARPEGILANTIFDLVGIVGLDLNGCPRVPRICWDNREHQFWDGFEGAYEPRNVVVNAPTTELVDEGNRVRAGYYYIANRIQTRVEWVIRLSPAKEDILLWDTFITVENLSRETRTNYLQFFACYHLGGTNSYWSSSGEIEPCGAGGFTAVAGPEQERRLRLSPYQRHCERYRGDAILEYHPYHRPVLLSERRAWFRDARHLVMVEPEKCAAVVTWSNQARDYMIRPPGDDLLPAAAFTARVRHVVAPAETRGDLERVWSRFLADLQQ